jgi:C-terminal processing protease CtpA/Prc
VIEADPQKAQHRDLPIAVRVDRHSASASEMFAGIMRRRAKIIGETTFGKGVQQDTIELPDGSGLAFTQAQFFTPDESPHRVGVQPHVTRAEAALRLRAEKGQARTVDPVLRFAVLDLARR